MKDNDIMALLTTMLEEQGCEDFCETIGYLEHMTRVHFLSIEDTLTLLTRICEGKRGYVCLYIGVRCAGVYAACPQLVPRPMTPICMHAAGCSASLNFV
jgi:hypothetical protein